MDLIGEYTSALEARVCQLRSHQTEGLKFLWHCYSKNHGCILADEMGLGKTCQAIAFLSLVDASVKSSQHFNHLVLCPLSTLDGWKREIERFGVNIKCKIYYGTKDEREVLRYSLERTRHEWSVLLTTYELCLNDSAFFEKFNWHVLIVDESQRLKNVNSLLYGVVHNLPASFTLLMTGTPIQNDLDELYSLLSLCAPKKFPEEGRSTFLDKYNEKNLHGSGGIAKLKQLLESYMLRRTKDILCSEIPKKSAVILFHDLTALQKRIYRAILIKNHDLFERSADHSKQRLLNTLVQLRKCVDHPYLFNGVEPEPFEIGEHLINASGKLLLLDSLLQFLKDNGHKVLLFSQMTNMLDILQDYLEYRGYEFERLDGSVRSEERYSSMKRFNKVEGRFVVFLLSTRAGGVGLNLQAADTVVFVDSDFNPQNDIQAAARAHRIGQERPVKMIRLVAKDTVDEIIIRRAEAKQKLAEAVLGDSEETISKLSPSEVFNMLMFGLGNISKETAAVLDENRDSLESLRKSPLKKKTAKELQKLLGYTINGRWVIELDGDGDRKDDTVHPATQKEQKATTAPDEQVSNIYMFEGRDYRTVSDADREAMNSLILEAKKENAGEGGGATTTSRLRHSTNFYAPTESLPAPRKRQKLTDEERKRREELKLQNLRQKWAESGYESLNLPEVLDDSASTASLGLDDFEEAGGSTSGLTTSLVYKIGDITDPQPDKEHKSMGCLTVHCVDDSGQWGKGGIFSAISLKWPKAVDAYELAHKMKDLSLGDAHCIPLDNKTKRHCLVLIIAQQRTKQGISGIKLPAFEKALRRIASYALQQKFSVHLPRIGQGTTTGINWYGAERTINKIVCRQGVPTYIYYYPRSSHRPISPTSVSSSLDNDDTKAEELSTDSDIEASTSSNLTDVFNGLHIYLHDSLPKHERRRLERFVVAFGGDCQNAGRVDLGGASHVVVNAKDINNDDLFALRVSLPPTAVIVDCDWLNQCTRARRVLDTKSYEVGTEDKEQI